MYMPTITLLVAAAASASPTLQLNGMDLTATTSRGRYEIRLPELSIYTSIAKNHAELLAYDTDGEVEYLLVSVVGASRPGSNPNGYCGAGQETSLVWIRLGHPDSEIRHQRVDSCAHLQSALRPVTCDDTACETEYIDADPPLSTVVFRYDRKAPGDGFSLVRTPVVKR